MNSDFFGFNEEETLDNIDVKPAPAVKKKVIVVKRSPKKRSITEIQNLLYQDLPECNTCIDETSMYENDENENRMFQATPKKIKTKVPKAKRKELENEENFEKLAERINQQFKKVENFQLLVE